MFFHRQTAKEFVRFGVVGACNTVLDFFLYYALTRSVPFFMAHVVIAAAISFCAAVSCSFVLNTFWTFQKDSHAWHRRSAKFFLVALVGLALNSVILLFLTHVGVHDLIAKLFATGVVILWNFTLQKTWTFRDT